MNQDIPTKKVVKIETRLIEKYPKDWMRIKTAMELLSMARTFGSSSTNRSEPRRDELYHVLETQWMDLVDFNTIELENAYKGEEIKTHVVEYVDSGEPQHGGF